MNEAKAKDKETKSGVVMQPDIATFAIPASTRVFGDKDLAIIVGIESYKNVPKSDYSYDDAFIVKEYLKALGIKDRNIEFLTDDNASLSAIIFFSKEPTHKLRGRALMKAMFPVPLRGNLYNEAGRMRRRRALPRFFKKY